MKKIVWVCILAGILALSACQTKEAEETENAHTYESDYVQDYTWSSPLLRELYYDYHTYYAGRYLLDGRMQVNIRQDAPEELLIKFEQTSSITHHLVAFSYAELWALKELIMVEIVDLEGFSGIGVSEKGNAVSLNLITGTEIPAFLDHYIETGMLVVDFHEGYATF